MNLSIVIAHRGDPMGLWATICSCESALSYTNFSYEYCLCFNGQKTNAADSELVKYLKASGKLGYLHESIEPIAPPTARQMAAEAAQGEILCFFDNHAILGPKYFERVIYDFATYGMDELHSSTIYHPGEDVAYEYRLALEKNFWTDQARNVTWEGTLKPYRIAAGGHGGFAVTRKVWEEVGGYWKGFQGYAGEEIYFDLKMGQFGKSVWIDPRLIHYHFAGSRGYARHYTDDYYRNLMMCARIIGGQKWMDKVFMHCSKGAKQKSDLTFFDLYTQAEQRSKQHAEELAKKRVFSLEELLEKFRRENISH